MLFGSVLYEFLIDATGTGSLGDVILSAADAEIGVDEVFGYWIEGGAAPMRITSCGRTGSSIARASLYSDRYHRLDPLARLAATLTDDGPTRSGRVLATEIRDPVYRRDCYERPGLCEKFSFVRRRGGRDYVLNFYRNGGRRHVADDALSGLAELVFPVLRKQLELVGDGLDLPLAMRVEQRLARAFPSLTAREKQVCARTLIGMTAEAIALDLGVGETTVLTYRRRAYERYRLSSAHEMIGKLLP